MTSKGRFGLGVFLEYMVGWPLIAAGVISFVGHRVIARNLFSETSVLGENIPPSFLAYMSVLLVGSVIGGIGAVTRRFGKRLTQPTGEEVLATDDPIVLYLRAFQRDKQEVAAPISFAPSMFARSSTGFEERLVKIFERFGTVVAIGRPGERIPPMGAARLYVSDDHWQQEVSALASRAVGVVLIVDDTQSMRWELGQMADPKSRRRLALILPPDDRTGWSAAWARLRQQFAFLPEVDDRTAAVYFDAEGTPLPVVADSIRAGDQLTAIEAALLQPDILMVGWFARDQAGDRLENAIVAELGGEDSVESICKRDDPFAVGCIPRTRIGADAWRSDLRRLARFANVVVFLFDDADGWSHELDELFEQPVRRKLLLVLPSAPRGKGFAARWESLRRRSHSLPEIDDHTIAVFAGDGRPIAAMAVRPYGALSDAVARLKENAGT